MTKKKTKKKRVKKQSAVENKLDDVLVVLTVIAERQHALLKSAAHRIGNFAQPTTIMAPPSGLPWATMQSSEPPQALSALSGHAPGGFAQDTSQLADPYMTTGVKRPEDL